MTSRNYWPRIHTRFGALDSGRVAIALLVVFLLSAIPHPSVVAPVVRPIRAGTGIALATVVPGMLLLELLGVRTTRFGHSLTAAVALGLATTTTLVLAAVVALSAVGLAAPLSFGPLAAVLVATQLLLVALYYYRDSHAVTPRIGRIESVWVAAGFVGLVPLAVFAALRMRLFDVNSMMFVFVAAVLVAVAATATRYVPKTVYPVAVFSVGLATFLHRNLVTGFVVGADVQSLYATANILVESQRWAPALGGDTMTVPVVTLAPAALSIIADLTLPTVFTVVYVLVFAFVPLGIYYLASDHFGPDVAVFGSYFFVFYHVTFSFTPGKQLLAGLFVVLLLDTLFLRDWTRAGRAIALVAWSVGLVFTHYATTYVFGGALLCGALVLAGLRAASDDVDARLPIGYPLGLLAVASVWYWAVSPSLFGRIASLPVGVAGQLLALLSTGAIPGSGTSYVQQQTSLLGELQVVVYLVCTALVAAGLGTLVGHNVRRLRRSHPLVDAEYTAVALPLFAFLGSSYFLVFNLWADRVYQMVLVVLAPLLPLGYLALSRGVGRRVSERWSLPRPQWSVVAALLVVLFALNSGFAFALAGDADTATFDADANDLAFSSDERAAITWLVNETNVTRTETAEPTGSRVSVDAPDQIQIYTDETSYQLFRGLLPSANSNAEVVVLKNEWKPQFDPANIDDAYVYIRADSVRSVAPGDPVPYTTITRTDRDAIVERGTVVFENDDAMIVRIGNPDG